jgi:hypothetical protein
VLESSDASEIVDLRARFALANSTDGSATPAQSGDTKRLEPQASADPPPLPRYHTLPRPRVVKAANADLGGVFASLTAQLAATDGTSSDTSAHDPPPNPPAPHARYAAVPHSPSQLPPPAYSVTAAPDTPTLVASGDDNAYAAWVRELSLPPVPAAPDPEGHAQSLDTSSAKPEAKRSGSGKTFERVSQFATRATHTPRKPGTSRAPTPLPGSRARPSDPSRGRVRLDALGPARSSPLPTASQSPAPCDPELPCLSFSRADHARFLLFSRQVHRVRARGVRAPRQQVAAEDVWVGQLGLGLHVGAVVCLLLAGVAWRSNARGEA